MVEKPSERFSKRCHSQYLPEHLKGNTVGGGFLINLIGTSAVRSGARGLKMAPRSHVSESGPNRLPVRVTLTVLIYYNTELLQYIIEAIKRLQGQAA